MNKPPPYGFDPDATVVQHVPGYWPPHPSSATPNSSYRYGTPLPRQEIMTELPDPLPAPIIETRSALERVLEAVMRVIVIITCVVILYVIWRGYVALSELGDQLEQLRAGWEGLGG